MKAILIAGTHSGCGKTTITLGLLAVLKRRGLSVQPFKTGPDFIDAGLHRMITGNASINLDLWMCGEEGVKDSFCKYSRYGDISIVEGVMGLFDGSQGTSALACMLGLPVILVIDAYGMAESAGAMVQGYSSWAEASGVNLAGIIFNRVGSGRHFQRLKNAVKDTEVLGYIPRDNDIEIPSRHLGLATADEAPLSPAQADSLAAMMEEHVNIDRLMELASVEDTCERVISRPGRIAPTIRIAVARDVAFSFYYDENLDLLKDAGAEIIFFSALWDTELPENTNAIYFGGGYPELHAAQLSQNTALLSAVRARAAEGMPIYAECGGLMYLSKGIRNFEGQLFEMAGVLPFETVMEKRRRRLGYRRIKLRKDCILGRAGAVLRGHEFHYSEIQDADDSKIEKIYDMTNADGSACGAEGFNTGSVLASYVHVHFGSSRRAARDFVNFIKGKTWADRS